MTAFTVALRERDMAASAAHMNLIKMLATEDRNTLEQAIESRVRTVYCGDGIALTRILGDKMLYVHTDELSVAPSLLMHGFWEFWISQAVARFLKPGMTFVDVGANYGYYTMLGAELVGAAERKGRVVAFECVANVAALLAQSVEVNGLLPNVQVVQGAVVDTDHPALGDVDITGYVRMPYSGVKGFSYGGQTAVASVQREKVGARKVERKARRLTLDGVLADEDRVDLIKVDVEGAEPLVWKGARELRARHNPVWCVEYEGGRSGMKDWRASVEAEGYRVRLVDFEGDLVPFKEPADPNEVRMIWIDRPGYVAPREDT